LLERAWAAHPGWATFLRRFADAGLFPNDPGLLDALMQSTDGGSSWHYMNSGTLYLNGYFNLAQVQVPIYASNEVTVAKDDSGRLFMYASWPTCQTPDGCQEWALGVWAASEPG
jgi:hypothetical protein